MINLDIHTLSLLPDGGWETGYDPVSVDITVDDILPDGTSTFTISLNMSNGASASVSGVVLNSGETYNLDCSSAGDTVVSLEVINETGAVGGINHSITDIVFYR